MFDFFSRLFDTSGFPTRWVDGSWPPGQGWLHILSDLAVWSACLAISCVLGLVLLRRRETPFRPLLCLFAAVWIANDPACHRITGNAASCELLRLPPGANASRTAPAGEAPTGFRVLSGGREVAPEELPMQYAAAHGVEVQDAELELVFT